ncbi:MAG TPA: tyrosine/phenylalanine carboxypeptidase domain-containing protein [Candidatus Saccharimonadia bacterium]|nr:tyrosine/phenylalanine carboxypeptidase domain-containing protein [Candidatus Saccharimonadia bacterium]
MNKFPNGQPPLSFIQSLNPLNRDTEKRKFMFDPLYNPQFLYQQRIEDSDLRRYGVASKKYMDIAESILKNTIKKFETESEFLKQAEGELLEKDALMTIIRSYLKDNNIENRVRTQFVHQSVSLASMNGDMLSIRTPIGERTKRAIGMLHHEIGTHFFRRLNEEKQPWFKNRVGFGFASYYQTEEGLASLHSHMFLEHPILWFPALYYYMVFKSQTLSFSELNEDIKQFVDDRERRWNMCVRVKRGMDDTSQPGGFVKDQLYLTGIIQVLEWLKENHYDPRPLYQGKLALDDLKKAQQINPGYVPLLPAFLNEGAPYKENILRLIKVNGLDAIE